ncbi:MAG: S-methyl-5'-thioadenosine phosphorylase [Acidimicrobiia bacterium]|nr:S-methyl-5'-thioadenosine phosphorylase [Acidimicrobiia bacterium]
MIGVFGGSGFYDFLDDPKRVAVDTPYGPPSAEFSVGSFSGVEVAFLPRHGDDHQFPAHRVPYRANAWAMKELGVDRVIGPCAVGSLQAHVEPGHLVVSDQIVDRSWGRESTFFDGPETRHLGFADPYCSELRPLAVAACREAGAVTHDGGTVVVIQGPRFSTRAESADFASSGWEIINMTQAPEAQLVRELELCYVNISVVTDYDAGVAGEIEPVTHAAVLEKFNATLGTLRDSLAGLIPEAAKTARKCQCATGMAAAG